MPPAPKFTSGGCGRSTLGERGGFGPPLFSLKGRAHVAEIFELAKGDHNDSTTSATLLARLKVSGDDAAWGEFARRYSRLIWWFGRSAGLETTDAEDLVQEVMGEFARQALTFEYQKEKGRFRGLLRTIAQRRAIDMIRRKRIPVAAAGVLERLESPRAMEEEWERLESTGLVLRALENASKEVEPITYQVFQLHVLEEWPVRRVAEFLGVSEASVYAAKSRVLARVRRIIEQEGAGSADRA